MKLLSTVIFFCVILGVTTLITRSAGADGCFTALVDRASRDPSGFRDLAKTTSATPMPEVEFLPLDTGENTKANIDFYYIKFARPGDRNIEDLFKELRTNFGSIITGISTDYGFGPYKSSADPQGKTNEKMWKSDNPLNRTS